VERPLTGEEKLRKGGGDLSADWIVLVEAGAAGALDRVSQILGRLRDAEPAMRYILAQAATR
jgi:hypothetical protein